MRHRGQWFRDNWISIPSGRRNRIKIHARTIYKLKYFLSIFFLVRQYLNHFIAVSRRYYCIIILYNIIEIFFKQFKINAQYSLQMINIILLKYQMLNNIVRLRGCLR